MSVVLAQGQIDHMRQTGISRIGTKDKLWDGVQIVRKLIRQTEPFSFRGRVWKFDRGALATPYYGDTPPDVLVAGGMDETLELVGRYADGWMAAIPGGTYEEFAERVARRYAATPSRPDANPTRSASSATRPASWPRTRTCSKRRSTIHSPSGTASSMLAGRCANRARFRSPRRCRLQLHERHRARMVLEARLLRRHVTAIHRDGSKVFSLFGNADEVLERAGAVPRARCHRRHDREHRGYGGKQVRAQLLRRGSEARSQSARTPRRPVQSSMTVDPRQGTAAPSAGSPARRPDSIRRTTTVDSTRPTGSPDRSTSWAGRVTCTPPTTARCPWSPRPRCTSARGTPTARS